MSDIPDSIREKIKTRDQIRKQGNFAGADLIRDELIGLGYKISDGSDGKTKVTGVNKTEGQYAGPGKLIMFGSGEMSSVGRKIHELAIKHLTAPIRISLLETPAGYEDNPHNWYLKLKKALETGLANHKPDITLVRALRSDGKDSTNHPATLAPLLTADYIHTGAGSPTYAVRHLRNSLALRYIKQRLMDGVPVSVASAVTVAFSRYALPVYEIYFAGHDPSWTEGLDFFADWGLNLTFLPHWNNTEGGTDIDTRFTYMGEKRLAQLLTLIPSRTVFVGIDEHTAMIFDFREKNIHISGKGSVTVIFGADKYLFPSGKTISFDMLSYTR